MKINYEKDFVAWADEQSILLEQERFAELDFIHLIEEVSDLGSNDKHVRSPVQLYRLEGRSLSGGLDRLRSPLEISQCRCEHLGKCSK